MMTLSDNDCTNVIDPRSLANYIRQLAKDLKEKPEDWENNSLIEYLMAMSAWIEDMEGYYKNKGIDTPPAPSWKTFAEILSAARVYE